MSTPAHRVPTPAEDRVGGWILAWLRTELTEDDLVRRLNAQVWRIDGATWDMRIALLGQLHHVLVQAREAAAEHFEQEPAECGSGERPVWVEGKPRWISECTGSDTCGVHTGWLRVWWDALAMFVGQVVTQVPIRAAASVEITMNGPGSG